MPFGLVNAPATFQRLMETCLGDLQLNWCLVYLDNIIVFFKMPKDHLVQLRAVFQKLKEAGLKFKPSKCEFFKKSLTYLVHRISEGGIKTDDSKIKITCEWPTPKTVTEARSFLGFTNYYHQFIYKYAQVAWPLYQLNLGENRSKKNKTIMWYGESEEAFRKLKEICTSTPILAYAAFLKTIWIAYQCVDPWLRSNPISKSGWVDCVIGYASRSLSRTEHNYLAHKLEFLALKGQWQTNSTSTFTATILSYT